MNSPYGWGQPPPWYGSPPNNTVYVPIQMPGGMNPAPRNKKEKKNTLKGLIAQIGALEELKKKIEGDKDKKKEEKKNELNGGDILKAWGMLTLFGPPVFAMYYYVFKHFFM